MEVQSSVKPPFLSYWPVLFGLVILYVPTYVDLASFHWSSERGAHGPIVLIIVAWLVWRKRSVFATENDDIARRWGSSLFILGLLFYIVGRSQQFFVFEVGSQIPVFLGLVLRFFGRETARALWFPICFLVFLVPFPGSLLDPILLPLKQYVSIVVDQLLYWAGYPIARNGVILSVGPYKLLIANACAGLNSMISLTAIGVLFVYLAQHQNLTHRWLLLLSILPIAFIANVIRVTTLLLVTFYYGDAAGRTVHEYAGYAEIPFTFGAFLLLDALLLKVLQRKQQPLEWV